MGAGDLLTAPHVLEYAYTRSTGPVIGAFLTGLRDGRVVGIRARDGRVVVPPQEYDPITSDPLDEMVDVGSVGTVTTWSWNPQPRPGQPLDRPFAWVLVQLDGADTPLLHALDVPSTDDVQTGMRVRIRWAPERVGAIGDIACFEPGDSAASVDASGGEDVTIVTTPMRLEYTYTANPVTEVFLRGTQERRLLGRRCSKCAKVYLPPRGVCSMCGAAFTDEIVEIADTGTVATFAVVNVNFASREVELPYAVVEVLFDGAAITSQFLIQGITHDQVRMGMRVKAVWKSGDLQPTLSNITHVEPLDEPDAPYESYREYV
jgi:hypothetical protein